MYLIILKWTNDGRILWACLPVSGATSLLYVVESLLKFLDDPSTRAIKNIADQLLEEADK